MSERWIPKEYAETFTALDLDRTLLNTDKLVVAVFRELVELGVSERQVESDIHFIQRQNGNSLSLLDYCEAEYGIDRFIAAFEAVIRRAEAGGAGDLLYEGAAELINHLEAVNMPAAVVTYGEEIIQKLKLRLLGIILAKSEDELAGHVTQQKSKGIWVATEWYDDEINLFKVPLDVHVGHLAVDTVIVIDDKYLNVTSPNPALLGIHIDNNGDAKDTRSIKEVAHQLASGKRLVELAHHYAA